MSRACLAVVPKSGFYKALRIGARALGIAALGISLLGHLAIVVCLYRSWDAVAAVTVFPIWVWAIGGLCLCAIAYSILRWKSALLIALIWIITVLIGSDERASLARGLAPSLEEGPPPTAESGARTLRVVSLNCHGRNIEAAREVARFNPDIVFLQEAPSSGPLAQLARELWGTQGTKVGAFNCAILARGKLTQRPRVSTQRAIGARLLLEDGTKIELMSVWLENATTRWDLWRPDCWREHRDIHLVRKQQLERFFGALESSRAGAPAIFAGDFNAPPTSNLFDLIPGNYANAFGTAGKGLGNTFINGFPVLRIDHAYASEDFTIVNARAARTLHSDHRMIVCDLLLEN